MDLGFRVDLGPYMLSPERSHQMILPRHRSGELVSSLWRSGGWFCGCQGLGSAARCLGLEAAECRSLSLEDIIGMREKGGVGPWGVGRQAVQS